MVTVAPWLLKIAAIRSTDTRRGTPIVSNLSSLEKRMRPGDIILTKPGDAVRPFMDNLTAWWLGNRWTHAGVYTGNGNVTHLYENLQGRKFQGMDTAKVREHKPETLAAMNRDMLILRPKVPKEEKQEAVLRAKAMRGTPFKATDILRAAFFRRTLPTDRAEAVPKSVICTAIPAFAYPRRLFSKRYSRTTLNPRDYYDSPLVKHIAAFSEEGKVENKGRSS